MSHTFFYLVLDQILEERVVWPKFIYNTITISYDTIRIIYLILIKSLGWWNSTKGTKILSRTWLCWVLEHEYWPWRGISLSHMYNKWLFFLHCSTLKWCLTSLLWRTKVYFRFIHLCATSRASKKRERQFFQWKYDKL